MRLLLVNLSGMATEKKGLSKEIYTYTAPWMVYSMAWSMRRDPSAEFRLAVGSFIEEYNNRVQVRNRFELARTTPGRP